MARSQSVLFVTFVVSAGLALAGCTLIGFGIGRAIDSKNAKQPLAVASMEIQRLRPGERVKLVLRDGATREGRYEGLAPVSPEYSSRYGQAQGAQGSKVLPVLGAQVEVMRVGGKVEQVAFQGFEPGSVLVVRRGEAESRELPFKDAVKVAWLEGSVDREALASRMNAGLLPCRSRLRIEGEEIPVETVDHLEMPRRGRHQAASRGALIGAVVDLVVLAAVAAPSFDDGSYDPVAPTPTSCPFVYAWDGERYEREAEMYGGALLAALARTDRAPLSRLRSQDGRLRLRVTNEQNEIDSIDRVALLEVESPPGGRVVSTPEGGMAIVRALGAARLATDRLGRDIRPMLEAEDGAEWVSDPFGLDPERDGPRDSLVLEFHRPEGVLSARLVFTLRSTQWGASLLADVLRLQGRGLPAYFARLESDEAERRRFVAAWAREGLPQIEVWDGTAYRHAGFLRNLGPVARSQALTIVLPPLAGNTLRVRLSATAGLWRVDRASADFAPEPPFGTRELRLLSARSLTGELVTESLRAQDGRVHTMAPGAAAVDLEFAALSEPLNGGRGRRAYVVEVAGHYSILLPATGDPQQATYTRILDEPGAFGRHALERLRRDALLSVSGGAAPGGPGQE